MLLLDGGVAAIPRVEADLERLAGRPIEVIDWTRQLGQITTATKVESSALLAFALVATLVTFVLGGIAIVRSVAASGPEVETLRAIGFTRRQTTTAAAARPASAVVVGVVGAAVIAWLLSGRYPIGVGRQGEPTPGRHANVAILAAGVAVLVLVGIAAAVLAAWRIGRPRAMGGAALRSRWGAVGTSDLPLPMTMGARLALERRPGVGGRAATAALAFGVTAVAAALTFGAGLDRGSQDGRLSGQSFDTYTVRVGAADVPSDAVAAWRDDERVVAATRVVDTVTPIGGRTVAVFALTDLKGRFDDHPLRGRIPAEPDEISFGPTEMHRLGLDVGDTVELGGHTMHVVGEVFTPQTGHTNYDEGARVAPSTLDALGGRREPGEVRRDRPRRRTRGAGRAVRRAVARRRRRRRRAGRRPGQPLPDPPAAAAPGRLRRHPHARRDRLRDRQHGPPAPARGRRAPSARPDPAPGSGHRRRGTRRSPRSSPSPSACRSASPSVGRCGRRWPRTSRSATSGPTSRSRSSLSGSG